MIRIVMIIIVVIVVVILMLKITAMISAMEQKSAK